MTSVQPPVPRSPAQLFSDYRRMSDGDSRDAAAWLALADGLARAKRWTEAVDGFQRVIALRPADPRAYLQLGQVFAAIGRRAEAEAAYTRVVDLAPAMAAPHVQLAILAGRHGDDAAALTHIDAALALEPGEAKFWQQRAHILERLDRPAEAAAAIQNAQARDPANDHYPFMLAPLQLRAGNFADGWQTYGLLQRPFWNGGDRPLPSRPWRGEPLAGKTILLTYDQGIGEQLMFAGMIRDLLAQGARVALEAEARLVPLLQRSFPAVIVVPWQKPFHPAVTAPDIDVNCIFGHAGTWLRPGFDSFPHHDGYLVPDPARTEALRARYLARAQGRRIVGLSWFSAAPIMGEEKSIPLPALEALLARNDVMWVNLQYGQARGTIDTARVVTEDDVDPSNTLDDAAAQAAAVDLVLTVSNVTAHFGGALGRPTWLMLPKTKGRHWFWFPERAVNPWYPSLRTFVQAKQDHWSDVIAAINAALDQR